MKKLIAYIALVGLGVFLRSITLPRVRHFEMTESEQRQVAMCQAQGIEVGTEIAQVRSNSPQLAHLIIKLVSKACTVENMSVRLEQDASQRLGISVVQSTTANVWVRR